MLSSKTTLFEDNKTINEDLSSKTATFKDKTTKKNKSFMANDIL